ncbi:hypothetical protein [Lacrimispora sp.]|uniref:hypothetical protein n=1 Tax=Lacrimispora sp. TaxID=2719234 RepID=UPI0034606134
MGVYKKAVITDAGRAMMARSIAGEAVMQFSRAVTSSYTYPPDTDFKGYISLEGVRQTVIPSNVQVVNDTLISVRGLFGNESIPESYLIQNIGLYATDGNEEILFSVSQATAPDEMPAYNGVAPSSFIYTIQAAISQASSLSLTINPAGTATAQDIQDLAGAKLDKHGDISETVVETLEPIENKFPIPAAGEKVKTFFGKILTFLRNIKPLEADVTYYIASSGSDVTGDGTQTKPFKSITKALNTSPKNLNGYTATISIADGTYTEDVYINGFADGHLIINGNVSTPGNVIIQSVSSSGIKINLNTCKITVQGISPKNVSGGNAVYPMDIYDTNAVLIMWCNIDGQGVIDGIKFQGVDLCISETTFNNCMACIATWTTGRTMSTCRIGSCYGNNNIRVAYATSGIIQYTNNIIPEILNPDLLESGGVVIKSSGGVIGTLQRETIYYVATTGSDATGDGTSAKPFKSIQRAIDSLPRDLGGFNATIYVSDGTYAENVVIVGFNNGHLLVLSDSQNTLNTNCKVKSIAVRYCGGYITVNGFVGTLIEDAPFSAWGSQEVRFRYCQVSATNNNMPAIYFGETNGQTISCRVANRKWALSVQNGNVTSTDWDRPNSINNLYGIYASAGGKISKSGNQPYGTASDELTVHGGSIINQTGTQITHIINTGLSCTWGAIQAGYNRHGNSNMAMVTIQVRIVTTTTLTSGAEYTINGFPAPFIDTACAVSDQPNVRNCYIRTTGQIVFKPNNNIVASTAIAFNCTYLTAI